MTKSPDAFRTISEVAEWLGIQAHVLRFWESKFSQVKPVKRAGGRRYYRPGDMLLLGGIKQLLHEDGLTIKGVQKILREQGVAHVSDLSQPLESTAEEAASGDVLEFKAVPDSAQATPTAEPANTELSEPAPEPERLEAEAAETTPEPEPEPEITPEDEEPPSPVPTFQHRRLNLSETPASAPEQDIAAPEPEEMAAETPAEPEPIAKPKPRIVDAPDPPLESEITVTPGILAQLARIDRINAEQARQIAPVLAELREWMGQNTGARSS